jgi:hypothetical protein
MPAGYLSDFQLNELKRLVGHRVTSIEECYWRSSEETALDYVTFTFEDHDPIVLCVGSTAEDVDLIDRHALEVELQRRGPSWFMRLKVTGGQRWHRLLGEEILDVLVKDEKGYAHSSIVVITSGGPTEVTTSADALEILLP